MAFIYKKSIDGNHFWKIGREGKEILHVSYIKEDVTVTKQYDSLTVEAELKKGDCCINTVEEVQDDAIDCSKEEFEGTLKQIIFELGLYEYLETEN